MERAKIKRVKWIIFIIIFVVFILSATAVVAKTGIIARGSASPGPLSSSHLKLDGKVNNCSSCHTKWKKVSSDSCTKCHDQNYFENGVIKGESVEGYKKDSTNARFHLRLSKKQDCLSCHTEHKGDKGKTRSGVEVHNVLLDKQLSKCTTCHRQEEKKHLKARKGNLYNGNCIQCHTTWRWKPVTFNHENLKKNEIRDCTSCHKLDAKKHLKSSIGFGQNCLECHSTKAWKPVMAGISGLVEGGGNCSACHSKELKEDHIARYGRDCARCHSKLDWKVIQFRHDVKNKNDCQRCHTNPPLPTHQNIKKGCSDCHSTEQWRPVNFDHEKLSAIAKNNCVTCHRKDADIHKGRYDLNCTNCHSTKNWRNSTFIHPTGLVKCDQCHRKPSSGMHLVQKNECTKCHTRSQSNPTWRPIRYDHTGVKDSNILQDCYSCHRQDFLKHKKDYLILQDCRQCHNLEKWRPAGFSHSSVQQACASCHFPPDKSWHRPFPKTCENCHVTTTWKVFEFDHRPWGGPIPPGHTGTCNSCHMD